MKFWRSLKIACFAFCILFSAHSNADEIIIDQSNGESISLGDFECSHCAGHVGNKLSLGGGSTTDLTAGELWQFFASQGVDSMENLTLCLDLQPDVQMSNSVGIHSIKFQISDPNGALLTDASLGQHSLVVPDYQITSSKPEAKLEFALGYDFMTRFTADSKEKVTINFDSTTSAETQPKFAIAAASEFLPMKFSVILLFGFVGFWGCVFLILNRLTKPLEQKAEEVPALAKSVRGQHALSA